MSELPAMMVASVPGRLVVATGVPMAARLADTQRTEPYTFRELAARWECSIDSVEVAVGRRFFKIGNTKMVRPGVVLEIERDREGHR